MKKFSVVFFTFNIVFLVATLETVATAANSKGCSVATQKMAVATVATTLNIKAYSVLDKKYSEIVATVANKKKMLQAANGVGFKY